SERQWGTVREDYSPDGESWHDFPHEAAPARAYRWGEDGLLGITDRQGRLALSLALWNGRDPMLKERLFGLTGPQGNHGEDVKEYYFYLDSTPTHSYMRALYKYPQSEFPYQQLVDENARRHRGDDEYELIDTGTFDENRYFDVEVEYAKASANDILLTIHIHNRGPEAAPIDVLPTLWFRNTWSWGRTGEGFGPRPLLERTGGASLRATHYSLGKFLFSGRDSGSGVSPDLLFTDNNTNAEKLFDSKNESAYCKDGFHEYVVKGRFDAIRSDGRGTKSALHYRLNIPAGGSEEIRVRLYSEEENPGDPFGARYEQIVERRREEAEEFYGAVLPEGRSAEEQLVARQSYAGLLWTKQFYHYSVKDWLDGDPSQPAPPTDRLNGRNRNWTHLYNRDVISMPDKWEYPWYAAWDLAFHMLPFAQVDSKFAKDQLLLMLREWYMHPNGQIPAYEFNFSDVNPPVHAWACWRVYKLTGNRGARDRAFLERSFQKLLLNFTWWVNRKDLGDNHIFSGGFLGLDNIGVFDRSRPLPHGAHLEQADGTAWMGFFCATMLSIALELARGDPVYEDIASKFLEHFVAISDAINSLDGSGLWDEDDGFYYDHVRVRDESRPVRVRSLVGLTPLFTVEVLDDDLLEELPGFSKRMHWFLENRPDLGKHVSCMATATCDQASGKRLLAIPSRRRLEKILKYLFDENEFLSPFGIRSLSRAHEASPFQFELAGETHHVGYEPGESRSPLFGGNSNWRGPIWFPMNYLILEALERYDHFYGSTLLVEFPTGSGRKVRLSEAARDISKRLLSLFLPGDDGRRPALAELGRRNGDWDETLLFHEYFHAESGKGLGASHQTGWTALVTRLMDKLSHGPAT
ncbi:MAG: glucosidase, partial [Planctomycetota bacterium]